MPWAGLLSVLAMAATADPYAAKREAMVELIVQRNIKNARVLSAMRQFPRHELVPKTHRHLAYEDHPLPIGHQQTISQPYIVAFMSEAAGVGPGDRVLEVGTGSGYQAAILASMGAEVYSIEIVEALATRSATDLKRLQIPRIYIRHGDGYQGWPEHAPFDAIVVTAAPPTVPPPLLAQLKEGGRLIIPVGTRMQNMEIHTRRGTSFEKKTVFGVRFVPMTGKAQLPDPP